MPLKPNVLERLVLFRLNRGPAPMLDLFAAGGFEAVSLSLDLGLFEALSDVEEGLSIDSLAELTDTNPTGLDRLCAFLESQGYLAASADGYRLTAMTQKWLTGPDSLAPFFTYWHELVFPFWDQQLEPAVRSGAPNQSFYEWLDDEPGRWDLAQEGFRATAMLLVDDVIDAITVPDGARTVIDVGGGHGVYATELCRRHPALSATIFDVPGAIDAVESDIPAELVDRLTTKPGDYLTDDLGTGYDIALVFNVIHAHEPTEIIELLERVYGALAPGGKIVVLDQWAESTRSSVGRAGLRFIALTYLVTLGADVYEVEAARRWLDEAGFTAVSETSVGPLSGLAIVEASKPAVSG